LKYIQQHIGEVTRTEIFLQDITGAENLHANVLVSETDFATVALALQNADVRKAFTGDFVKIDGDVYHVIKTNPRVAGDFIFLNEAPTLLNATS
jgi:hypothetical protein